MRVEPLEVHSLAEMYLENTTSRLLHLAYSVAGAVDKNGKPEVVGRYLQLDADTPGVLPGAHEIDPDTARLIREHPSNGILFDSGMVAIKDGPLPKIESPLTKGPKIYRADASALAAVKRAAQMGSAKKGQRSDG